MRDSTILNRRIREGFSEERTFEQRPEWREKVSHEHEREESVPGMEKSKLGRPKTGVTLARAELRQEVIVPGPEEQVERLKR